MDALEQTIYSLLMFHTVAQPLRGTLLNIWLHDWWL